jgi:hypothetical protein
VNFLAGLIVHRRTLPIAPAAKSGDTDSPMTSDIPLTCPHCGKTMAKTVEWVQQNTYFT